MSAYREAVWEAVPADAVPEAFAARRAWLLGRLTPRANVVDLGCGDASFTTELLASGATVIGLDVAEAALERARRRAPSAQFLVVGEDGALPVADRWADVVWAGEVLEHALDPVGLVLESRRVLRPGGRLLVTTPAHGPLLTRVSLLDPRADHLRFFTARSLRSVLAEAFAQVTVRRRRGRLYACAS